MYVYEHIVRKDSRIKLINGSAGSAKTTLLIKCGMDLFLKGKNVVFLTKIGSVTDEIKTRIEEEYHQEFTRSSNHFLTEKNSIHLEVANFDAFVDKQLKMYKTFTDGDAFNNKVDKLVEKMELLEYVYLKNDVIVDAIFIDEVQDFDKNRLVLIVELLKRQKNLKCVMVGDTMQTIFKQSMVDEKPPFCFLVENLPEGFYYKTLTNCYRCPKPHIDFVNEILGEYYEKQNIPSIETQNEMYEHKPVLFQHGSLGTEKARGLLAKNIIYFIKFILTYDKTIRPDDIVILMNKTNANALFEKIIVFLRKFYEEFYKGEGDFTIHYETKQSDGRVTIDWDLGKNKTKLMSIHGDKGKGHKVVIMVGVSEKSIPMPETLFKPEELIPQSVLNVGLTRSKKYLFVGFNSTPSRYIYDKMEDIMSKRLAYCTWDATSWPSKEESLFYYHLMSNIPNKKDKLKVIDKYVRREVFTPTKNLMNVSYDIVQELHISDCLKQYQLIFDKIEKIVYGKRQFIPEELNPTERAIVGIAVELIIQHVAYHDTGGARLKIPLFETFIKQSSNFFYCDSQMVLGDVHEMHLNNRVGEDIWFNLFQELRQKYDYISSLKEWFDSISKLKRPVYIISDAWKHTSFSIPDLLREYYTQKDITKLSFDKLWKLAVFYASLSGIYYVESIYTYINTKTQRAINPTNLYQNCKNYYQHFIKGSQYVEFQKDIKKTKVIYPGEVLERLNYLQNESQTKYEYGILGICDAITCKNGEWTLHEFKSSSRSDDSKRKVWLFQTLVYVYLLNKFDSKKGRKPDNLTKIHIANLTAGVLYTFDLTNKDISYKKLIASILKKKDFPDEMIDMYV
jgi:thymidine kinase